MKKWIIIQMRYTYLQSTIKKLTVLSVFLAPFMARADYPVDPWTMLNGYGRDVSYSELQDFMEIYQSDYQQCRQIDVFIQAGRYFARVNHSEKTTEMMQHLSSCPGIKPVDKFNALNEMLYLQKKNSAERIETAKKILKISPDNAAVLSDLAWQLYDAGKCQQAVDIFQHWYEISQDPAALDGLSYCRSKLAEKEVVREQDSVPEKKAKQTPKEKKEALKQKLYALSASSGERISTGLQILKLDPRDVNALEDLSWRYYDRADYINAQKMFEKWYEISKSKKAKEGLLYTQRQNERIIQKRLFETVDGVKVPKEKLQSPVYQKARKKSLVLQSNEKDWFATSGFSTLSRSGDKGRGRLFEVAAPQDIFYQGKYYLKVTPTYLYSGKAPLSAEIGSAYLRAEKGSLGGGKREEYLVIPEIGYIDDNLNLSLGATGFGGEQSALPTGTATVKIGSFSISAYQRSIHESILSISGLKDNYTGKTWGRVVKDGLTFKYAPDLKNNYFLETWVTGDYIWGKDVEENTAYQIAAIGGKSWGHFATGIFSSFVSFDKDLNHFTYGHGGYYSPQAAFLFQPFISFETDPMQDKWFKANLGIGYLYEHTKDVDMYFNTPLPQQGKYEGETHHWIVYQIGAEGRIKLTETVSVSAETKAGFSANYHELSGGVFLKMVF